MTDPTHLIISPYNEGDRDFVQLWFQKADGSPGEAITITGKQVIQVIMELQNIHKENSSWAAQYGSEIKA
jgi:hypothetical protein